MEQKFKLPTEVVELPSKGKLYPADSPLASGKVEMKYMTAKEEDILTNANYIKQGIVIDKLLKSLLISDVDYNDILVGDKNAMMVAARILAYGKEYEFEYDGVKQTIDLSNIEPKPLSPELEKATENEFSFTLPSTGNVITFKLLTHGEDVRIDQEVKGLQKINKDNVSEVTVRLSHLVTSINGSRDQKDIRDFVNNYFLARDAREFRKFYNSINPDLDLSTTVTNSAGEEEDVDLPIGLTFFWPDARI
jgi:hypothetical protein